MTAPVLSKHKFYIIKPAVGTNYLKNPRFDPPDGVEDWTAYGPGVTIALTGSEQRFGAYCMQINPVAGVGSYATSIVPVSAGLSYTFSCYLKGAAGVMVNISIRDNSLVSKASKNVTFTGYWQRAEVTWLADATASNYKVDILQTSSSTSSAAFYVDGVQFEQASAASTLMHGYAPGCRWSGIARNSSTIRSVENASGGQIIDLESYCHVVQAVGLGHGDWNQTLTKMTSGGDMYQDYTRKSRQFSLIVDFLGTSLGEIETNRKAVIDLIRPDQWEGQEMVVRYQGVDVNGVEATHPIDIRCVPLPATLVDTPDLPTYQRAVLNFAIPSGLLEGAYNDGGELDLYAEFAAEYIVKRDAQGNWCEGPSTDGSYSSLVTGLNGAVYCMAQGPDGKIYVGGSFTDAGGTTDADYLARWNPITEAWESVISGISGTVYTTTFDPNGDLYIGGSFHDLGSTDGDDIVKISDPEGSPTISALGTGLNYAARAIEIDPSGIVYVGGSFTKAGGDGNNAYFAYYDNNTDTWSTVGSGLNGAAQAFSFAPNGDLYIGGQFINATTDGYGDYLCYKRPDENVFKRVSISEPNDIVLTLAFDGQGRLYVGGAFTTIGSSNISYIARWNGNSWEALGSGVNGVVRGINIIYDGDPTMSKSAYSVYVTGDFTTAGGMTITDRIAVWRNGAWQALDIDLPGSASVNQVLKASDGSLYIGGAFSSASSSDNVDTGIVAVNVEVSSASANTYPFMQIRGPGTLKGIANYTTGKSIQFDGLTLLAGEHINLQFDPLDLRFYSGWSGRGNLMRYVVAGSDYGNFYLKPGSNSMSLFMTGTTTDSGAFMFWTPKFWGVDGALL